MNINEIKQIYLPDFLARHYAITFKKSGQTFVAISPFSDEKNPSFCVREVNGCWLFKDFSSGRGGSIIDFVSHMEGLPSISDTINHIKHLVGDIDLSRPKNTNKQVDDKSYDIHLLYSYFRKNPSGQAAQYVLNRGISPAIVENLVATGDLLYNYYRGQAYCCFAVRDAGMRLKAIESHQIDGSRKFTLGVKHIYTIDWERLQNAERIFITEGIIDYLSVKTIEGESWVGLALMGNQPIFDPGLLSHCPVIVSALDDDPGGQRAFKSIQSLYPEKRFVHYDLCGRNDPNEFLRACIQLQAQAPF